MKNILYLTFYFEPDLCAGSFRNSPLVAELAQQGKETAHIDVITTLPNRYSSFVAEAPAFEERGNVTINRITIPKHQSGMKDQVLSFKTYFNAVKKYVRDKKYDLVVASSSRLFTAYLGYTIAKKMGIPLYLDIRDIFYDTLEDVLTNGMIKKLALPVIKQIEKRTFGYASHINLISGGFKPYFESYKNATYSFFPNGIDDVFIQANEGSVPGVPVNEIKTIVYAGNLGEGQGLHKIVPLVAKRLANRVRFTIIGDGGAKEKLEQQLSDLSVSNVEIVPPVKRAELIEIYKQADFLFVHLNNYKAFEKVLPSKLFELATFPQPIIAGVGGFAAQFVSDNIENNILFDPCDVDQFVAKFDAYEYKQVIRDQFMEQYTRNAVNQRMASSILNYLS